MLEKNLQFLGPLSIFYGLRYSYWFVPYLDMVSLDFGKPVI